MLISSFAFEDAARKPSMRSDGTTFRFRTKTLFDLQNLPRFWANFRLPSELVNHCPELRKFDSLNFYLFRSSSSEGVNVRSYLLLFMPSKTVLELCTGRLRGGPLFLRQGAFRIGSNFSFPRRIILFQLPFLFTGPRRQRENFEARESPRERDRQSPRSGEELWAYV